SRRRHTRSTRDWSSDVCSSDLTISLLTITSKRLPTQRVFTLGPLNKAGPAFTHNSPNELRIRRFCALSLVSAQLRQCTFRHGARSEERRVGKEDRSRTWSEPAK